MLDGLLIRLTRISWYHHMLGYLLTHDLYPLKVVLLNPSHLTLNKQLEISKFGLLGCYLPLIGLVEVF